MTIDEAIKHAEEVAEEHERHLKVYENMDEDRPLFREEENECKDCAEEHRQLAGWLKELKQLRKQTKKGHWIPVSERLPKPYTYVNATCRSLADDRENWVVETMYLPIPKENDEQGYSDWGNIPMLNLGKAEVIAWMERKMPEPYKADNRTEQGLAYADQDTMMPAT